MKMRFKKEIVDEAQTLLRKIFEVLKKEEMPPVRFPLLMSGGELR